MSSDEGTEGRPETLSLVVRRLIAGTPDDVFSAWTEPAQLLQWWGPRGVTLASAEIDLRVGGRYRFANRFDDGSVLWVTGVFELIERPNRIVYSWAHEPITDTTDHTRVTVLFEQREQGTEVIVLHEGFRTRKSHDDNETGWVECLDALLRFETDTAGHG